MLDDMQLEEVREEHNRTGKSIGEILQDFNYIDLDTQLQLIANQMGTEVVDLSTRELTPDILSAIPADAARMYKCLPVAVTDSSVHIAFADPLDPTTVDQLAFVTRKDIVPVVADPNAIEMAVSRYYGDSQSSVADIIKELGQPGQ
jgi:type IV pilus assembly protein PilB